MRTVEESRVSRRIRDDYDVLELSKELNEKLKASDWFFSLVYSQVDRVDEGFYITPKLEIAVASLRHVKEKNIPESVLEDIYYAALSHENAHAIAFPFMTRMNLTYAVIHGYCKKRNIPFITSLFNNVENIISDIFNELVIYTHKLEGYKELPKLRYYYIYLPSRDVIRDYVKNRHMLEKDPVNAVFITHNVAFASLYKGKIKSPRVPNPKWLSEYLYNSIFKIAQQFRVRDHIEMFLTGTFTNTINMLIRFYDLYSAIDTVYKRIKEFIKSGNVRISGHDFWEIEQVLDNPELSNDAKQYWSYFIILASLYRYSVENPDSRSRHMPNVDCGKGRPAPPSPDVLDNILNQIQNRDILSPQLADYVAKRLLSAALMTPKTTFETSYRSGVTKIPWYRRPRGKIDPLSLLKPSILDWRVQVSYNVPEYRKAKSSSVGVPDVITAVIDESGSTADSTSILSPLIGVDTTVFDVERVTIMGLLYNVLQYTDTPKTTLVRFSSSTRVEEGSVRDIYNRLRDITSSEITWGGTEIEDAVEIALQHHRDKPTNYFLLATDMEISESQAKGVKDIILSEIRRSPVLILAVNADIPPVLLALNKYPNIAVVSVKNMFDYPKLESAIKKLARLIMR